MTPEHAFGRWPKRHRLLLWAVSPFLAPMLAVAETPSIPGTGTSIDVLPAALEWEFGLLGDTDPEHLTLTRNSGGPAADHAVTYRYRSVDPYGGEPGSRTYLRFALTAYEFSGEATARAAFATTFPPDDTREYSSLCFAGGYWLQVSHWVYRLDVPCLFSRANYEKLVRALKDALDIPDNATWRAVQCYCGGSFDLSG